MNKIPVVQVIGLGYAFLVAEFRTVLRVCWLPALLIAGADYLTRRYSLFYVGEAESVATLAISYLVLISGLFVVLLNSAIMMTGMVRHALRLPLTPGSFYFPFGPMERRMFRALTLLALGLFFALSFLSVISAQLFTLAGVDMTQPPETQTPGAGALFVSLTLLLLFIAVFVAALRIGFLLAPVVVAEGKGLARSFQLSNGNFWRILAVLLVAILPLGLTIGFVQLALITATAGQDILTEPSQSVQGIVESVAAAQPVLWAALNFASTVLAVGLIYPIAAFAYGTITTRKTASEL
ncbi:MAG: hypothetical protein RJB62_1482 [Pseudomonadota bacterium]|jgi:hypothetical protein